MRRRMGEAAVTPDSRLLRLSRSAIVGGSSWSLLEELGVVVSFESPVACSVSDGQELNCLGDGG